VLKAFFQRSYVYTLGEEGGVSLQYRLQPSYLEPFLDTAPVVERARQLLRESELSDDDRLVLDTLGSSTERGEDDDWRPVPTI
jgi:hypothetical protein